MSLPLFPSISQFYRMKNYDLNKICLKYILQFFLDCKWYFNLSSMVIVRIVQGPHKINHFTKAKENNEIFSNDSVACLVIGHRSFYYSTTHV